MGLFFFEINLWASRRLWWAADFLRGWDTGQPVLSVSAGGGGAAVFQPVQDSVTVFLLFVILCAGSRSFPPVPCDGQSFGAEAVLALR